MFGEKAPFNFIRYLATEIDFGNPNDPERLPTLSDISKETGVSTSTLREQLEVARTLGFVEVKPRTGIRRLPYKFGPAVTTSLYFALQRNRAYFEQFAEMRRSLEKAFWMEAIKKLDKEDIAYLENLINRAKTKLASKPIHVPQQEHKELHLHINRKLDNEFVLGINIAYWRAYEMIGFDRYQDLEYLVLVWDYHEKMILAIKEGRYDDSYKYLIEHLELLDTESGLSN